MDRFMFYSGSLMAKSHKMLKIQVAPEKSGTVFDLTLGGEYRRSCVYTAAEGNRRLRCSEK